jgi:hypothetical protein
VNDAPFVEMLQRHGGLPNGVRGTGHVHRATLLDDLFKRRTIDVFQGHVGERVVLAQVIRLGDVGVLKDCQDSALTHKAVHRRGVIVAGGR